MATSDVAKSIRTNTHLKLLLSFLKHSVGCRNSLQRIWEVIVKVITPGLGCWFGVHIFLAFKYITFDRFLLFFHSASLGWWLVVVLLVLLPNEILHNENLLQQPETKLPIKSWNFSLAVCFAFRQSEESEHSVVVSYPSDCFAHQWQLPLTYPSGHCQTTQPGVLGPLIQQDQELACWARQHGISQVSDCSLLTRSRLSQLSLVYMILWMYFCHRALLERINSITVASCNIYTHLCSAVTSTAYR